MLICSSLTSCVDVIEEVRLNSDGSLDLTITCNFSKNKTKIASVMLLDSVNGMAIPKKEHIDSLMDVSISALQEINGISNVSVSRNWDDFIFVFNAHAKNADLLNQAVNKMKNIYKLKDTVNTTVYAYENNTFKRINQYSYKDSYKVLIEGQDSILSESIYTSVFRFPKDVQSMSNQDAKLSPNKKAIMFRSNLLDIVQNNKSFANTIYLQE